MPYDDVMHIPNDLTCVKAKIYFKRRNTSWLTVRNMASQNGPPRRYGKIVCLQSATIMPYRRQAFGSLTRLRTWPKLRGADNAWSWWSLTCLNQQGHSNSIFFMHIWTTTAKFDISTITICYLAAILLVEPESHSNRS